MLLFVARVFWMVARLFTEVSVLFSSQNMNRVPPSLTCLWVFLSLALSLCLCVSLCGLVIRCYRRSQMSQNCMLGK